MTPAPKLDGRRATALTSELMRRAHAVLSGDGRDLPVGEVATAALAIAARIGEEVTRRLDEVPAKQADNFYTLAGIGRDPARPAAVALGFRLAEGVTKPVTAPAGTRLMAAGSVPVLFETEAGVVLAPGRIAAVRAVDAEADSVFLPHPGLIAAKLPRTAPLRRSLRSGAAAGSVKVQLDPAAGLEPGMLLAVGEGEEAGHYVVAKVDGDLVTLDSPLERTYGDRIPVVEADAFAPFRTPSRDHQSHSLYLGHPTLLDVPSRVTISVLGAPLPEEAEWSWWGKTGEDEDPDWQPLGRSVSAGRLQLAKGAGKPVKKTIRGHESLWLRARLPGKSAGSVAAREIRIAVAAEAGCDPLKAPCNRAASTAAAPGTAAPSIEFEAIAGTTPVVTNTAFQPFGREPRIFDSFYMGSKEAFSKAGADVSLCFEFGGPDLGPIAAVGDAARVQVFGVGSDGILYRADFATGVAPQFQRVPHEAGALRGHASIAARLIGDAVHLVFGATGHAETLEIQFQAPLGPLSGNWKSLKGKPGDEMVPADAVAIVEGAGGPVSFALFGKRLLSWENGGPFAEHPVEVTALVALQGTDAILFVEAEDGSGTCAIWRQAPLQPVALFARVPAGDLPAIGLAAWAPSASSPSVWVAGFDASSGDIGFATLVQDPPVPGQERTATRTALGAGLPRSKAPITFEPPPVAGGDPAAVVAAPVPQHFIPVNGIYHVREDEHGIGFKPGREILTQAGWSAVQSDDAGLLYRPAGSLGRSVELFDLTVSKRAVLVEETDVPPSGALFAIRKAAQRVPGEGFYFDLDGPNHRLLQPLPGQAGAAEIPSIAGIDVYEATGPAGSVLEAGANPRTLDLVGAGSLPSTVINIFLWELSADRGIWEMTLDVPSGKWTADASFPDVSNGFFGYVVLETPTVPVPLREGAILADPAGAQQLMNAGALLPVAIDTALPPPPALGPLETSGSAPILFVPHDLLSPAGLRVARPTGKWNYLGPERPAKPALSWEYWNGQSWWALAPGELADQTVNFQKAGGVFFKVPPDLRETEVGGRKNFWIRARLVGGDYGEARVTIRPGDNGEQVATRDVESIRAPYVTAAWLGYCAETPVLPEFVVTEDSLGTIERTSANEAGLPIPVFVPLAELMNPVPPAAPAGPPGEATCADPCPPPPIPPPSPCDAPGAFASCDMPCLDRPDGAGPATPAASGGVTRGLMIGFERAFAADPVAFHVDAEPSGPPVELVAEVLRGGRFVPAGIVGDTSYGLTESGILMLSMPEAPERSDLLGASACWLRLRPKADGTGWTPRLRAIQLNAAPARSVETRRMEILGSSSGFPGQVFRLAERPVAQGSLELRVQENPGEEEQQDLDLDVTDDPGGMRGRWVLWQPVERFTAAGEPGTPRREYRVDLDAGILVFGDGSEGMIPPLGAQLLALSYRRVIGEPANAVPAGAKLQLLSPLAGVDSVLALDHAAGGSDVEPLAAARRRAPSKLRRGGRILTLADLEEHALSFPGMAQARAELRRGTVRLIVVMAASDPRPSPAQLRELQAALRELAGFGLARTGRLVVVAPRLLLLAARIRLRPVGPGLFPEAAAAARAALERLLDPASGGHDELGWPTGRLPREDEAAAALDSVSALATIEGIELRRAGRDAKPDSPLPESIGSDILVRLDPADLVVERAGEALP